MFTGMAQAYLSASQTKCTEMNVREISGDPVSDSGWGIEIVGSRRSEFLVCKIYICCPG